MDQRLRHVVAREPGEVVPVAELVFHFAPGGLASDQAVGRAQVIALDGDDLADLAVVDAFDGLAPAEVIAIGESGQHARAVLLGQLVGLQELQDASHIDGGRLLDEHVLLGLHGGQRVGCVETRCAGDQHDVTVLDHAPVAVQTRKSPRRIDLDALAEFGAQVLDARLDLVRQRRRPSPTVACSGSPDRASAAAPEPRPPQPISPSLIVSLPAACALRLMAN